MKKLLGMVVLAAIILSSCNKPGSSVKLKNDTDSISYLLGLAYAKGAKMNDFKIDPKIIAMAFEQVASGDSIKISDQEINMKLQMYYMKIQNEIAENNKKEGEK